MPTEVRNTFRVEKAALDLLARYGITKPSFDIEDVAAAEGIRVRRGSLHHVDAWLVRTRGGGGIIRIRDDMVEPGRIRFSIGHELGHWEMHPNLSQGFLCTASDFTDYARSSYEAEANLFSANLLMPRPWMHPELWKTDPSFVVVSAMAKEFGTTLTAASRRFVELSRHAVALVFSRDGQIQWSIKSPSAQALYIANGAELPKFCFTRECLEEGTTPSKPDDVDPHEWFPSWRFRKDSELFEDVRVSTNYGWALTLLWLPELS
jgi:hypothetical protein